MKIVTMKRGKSKKQQPSGNNAGSNNKPVRTVVPIHSTDPGDKAMPSVLYRFIRGMANTTQREAARAIEYNKLRYMRDSTMVTPEELLSGRNQSFEDLAAANREVVRTQELADRIVFQDQVSTGVTIRKAMISTVYSYSFVFTLLSASVLAWIYSRDAAMFVPEEQDTAFTSMFSTLVFMFLGLLFLEHLVAQMTNYVYMRVGYFTEDALSENLDLSLMPIRLILLWFKVTRYNFYITTIMVAIAYLMEASGRPAVTPNMGLFGAMTDMRYVRRDAREQVFVNHMRMAPKSKGISNDLRVFDIVPNLLSPYAMSDPDMVVNNHATTFSVENMAGKMVWLLDTKALGFTQSKTKSTGYIFGSSEEDLPGADKTLIYSRMAILVMSGLVMADGFYRYTMDQALFHLPNKAKVVAPI